MSLVAQAQRKPRRGGHRALYWPTCRLRRLPSALAAER